TSAYARRAVSVCLLQGLRRAGRDSSDAPSKSKGKKAFWNAMHAGSVRSRRIAIECTLKQRADGFAFDGPRIPVRIAARNIGRAIEIGFLHADRFQRDGGAVVARECIH